MLRKILVLTTYPIHSAIFLTNFSEAANETCQRTLPFPSRTEGGHRRRIFMLASNRSHPEEKTPPPRRSREGGGWTREADADLRSKHLRHQLGLGEEEQVIVAAGLGVGARHVEAAEGMDSHQGAGALAVEVQVPHVELGARLFQVGAVPADHRSGEAVFRVVG